MDHKQAVEDHAVERYFLGELSPEERDAFEEHYFTCTECAAEVCAGARFRANARRVLAQPESIPARLAWSWSKRSWAKPAPRRMIRC